MPPRVNGETAMDFRQRCGADPILEIKSLKSLALLEARLDGQQLALRAAGAWTSERAGELERLIERTVRKYRSAAAVEIDMGGVERLDTFGAWLLERLRRGFGERPTRITGLAERYRGLIDDAHGAHRAAPAPRRRPLLAGAIGQIGRTVGRIGHDFTIMVNMVGAVAASLARVAARPWRFRLTSLVHHLDLVGWRAVPVVLLITFLIGAILAQQGLFHFRRFGADIYVVDMIGILVLREVGVLMVAIMVAGRSGSSYTAELGSMKMREEIDALRTMGFDPIDVLILPRVLALVIATPLLTFLGAMAALYGGGLMCWLYGGMSPDVFLARLRDVVTLPDLLIGLFKAPFMALVIGVVASVQGLEVRGSTESLGWKTTDSVVKSIFMVILLDGLFAVFFAAIGV